MVEGARHERYRPWKAPSVSFAATSPSGEDWRGGIHNTESIR